MFTGLYYKIKTRVVKGHANPLPIKDMSIHCKKKAGVNSRFTGSVFYVPGAIQLRLSYFYLTFLFLIKIHQVIIHLPFFIPAFFHEFLGRFRVDEVQADLDIGIEMDHVLDFFPCV